MVSRIVSENKRNSTLKQIQFRGHLLMQVGGSALQAPLTPHVREGGPDSVNPASQEYVITESHRYLATTWRDRPCSSSFSSSSSRLSSSSKAAKLPPVLRPFNMGPGSEHVTAVR